MIPSTHSAPKLLDAVRNSNLNTFLPSLAKHLSSCSQELEYDFSPFVAILTSKQVLSYPIDSIRLYATICLTEILRITAPQAPFSEEQLRSTLNSIIQQFRFLADPTSSLFEPVKSLTHSLVILEAMVLFATIASEDDISSLFSSVCAIAQSKADIPTTIGRELLTLLIDFTNELPSIPQPALDVTLKCCLNISSSSAFPNFPFDLLSSGHLQEFSKKFGDELCDFIEQNINNSETNFETEFSNVFQRISSIAVETIDEPTSLLTKYLYSPGISRVRSIKLLTDLSISLSKSGSNADRIKFIISQLSQAISEDDDVIEIRQSFVKVFFSFISFCISNSQISLSFLSLIQSISAYLISRIEDVDLEVRLFTINQVYSLLFNCLDSNALNSFEKLTPILINFWKHLIIRLRDKKQSLSLQASIFVADLLFQSLLIENITTLAQTIISDFAIIFRDVSSINFLPFLDVIFSVFCVQFESNSYTLARISDAFYPIFDDENLRLNFYNYLTTRSLHRNKLLTFLESAEVAVKQNQSNLIETFGLQWTFNSNSVFAQIISTKSYKKNLIEYCQLSPRVHDSLIVCKSEVPFKFNFDSEINSFSDSFRMIQSCDFLSCFLRRISPFYFFNFFVNLITNLINSKLDSSQIHVLGWVLKFLSNEKIIKGLSFDLNDKKYSKLIVKLINSVLNNSSNFSIMFLSSALSFVCNLCHSYRLEINIVTKISKFLMNCPQSDIHLPCLSIINNSLEHDLPAIQSLFANFYDSDYEISYQVEHLLPYFNFHVSSSIILPALFISNKDLILGKAINIFQNPTLIIIDSYPLTFVDFEEVSSFQLIFDQALSCFVKLVSTGNYQEEDLSTLWNLFRRIVNRRGDLQATGADISLAPFVYLRACTFKNLIDLFMISDVYQKLPVAKYSIFSFLIEEESDDVIQIFVKKISLVCRRFSTLQPSVLSLIFLVPDTPLLPLLASASKYVLVTLNSLSKTVPNLADSVLHLFSFLVLYCSFFNEENYLIPTAQSFSFYFNILFSIINEKELKDYSSKIKFILSKLNSATDLLRNSSDNLRVRQTVEIAENVLRIIKPEADLAVPSTVSVPNVFRLVPSSTGTSLPSDAGAVLSSTVRNFGKVLVGGTMETTKTAKVTSAGKKRRSSATVSKSKKSTSVPIPESPAKRVLPKRKAKRESSYEESEASEESSGYES
ncbi:hypothetical protein RCL1_006189 [Eukaryota sp. TZLM3-RCL]